MFSRVRSFIYRHRRKFIVTGVICGGAVLLSRYAQRAFREWQQRETKEFLERNKKQQHHESIERTCNQAALNMIPTLKEAINIILPTKELIGDLQNKAPNKIMVWEELKIMSFSKVTALVYASTLLVVTLRVQLNLIGGYMFQSTTNDLDAAEISSALQEKYLGLCQYFLENGMQTLCTFVVEKVKQILHNVSLKKPLTLHDIEQIFWTIQSSIGNDENDPCKNFLLYVIPPSFDYGDLHAEEVPLLEKIITETQDMLESEEVVSLAGSCVSRGLSFIMDQIADYLAPKDTYRLEGSPIPSTSFVDVPQPQKEFVNVTKVSIATAKLIPIINGMIQGTNVKDDMPHLWIQQLILIDSLKVMGANVYETFSNKG